MHIEHAGASRTRQVLGSLLNSSEVAHDVPCAVFTFL
jgi:hypothetical protein